MDSLTFDNDNLRVARVQDHAALHGLVDELLDLDKSTSPRSPFTSPAWIRLWWIYFKRNTLIFQDSFFCLTVRDPNGHLVGVAPLMLTGLPGTGFPALRIVQFFGTDPSLTEFRGVICRPEDRRRVIDVIQRYFMQHAGHWDVLRWSGLRESDFDDAENGILAGVHLRGDTTDYIMDLPGRWDDVRARVSSNMRKNLRKQYELLEQDNIRFTFRAVEDPGNNRAAVETFLSLHAARSEVPGMINHPNKFQKPNIRRFLFHYLEDRSGTGEVLLFELEIDGKVVASRLAFRLDTDLYLYFGGYDPQYRRYSIMTVLIAEIIKWAIASGLRRLNLSAGTDQSKLRWKPTELRFREALQIAPTIRGRFAYQIFLVYEYLAKWRDARALRASGQQTS